MSAPIQVASASAERAPPIVAEQLFAMVCYQLQWLAGEFQVIVVVLNVDSRASRSSNLTGCSYLSIYLGSAPRASVPTLSLLIYGRNRSPQMPDHS